MHILMLAERLPPAIGGVERHVAGLARVLVERGYRVTLVAPQHKAALPEEEEMDGAHVVRLPFTGHGWGNYLRAWCWWMKHGQLLKEADVIHFHDVYAFLHWFGPARLLCLTKRIYLTYHGFEMSYPIPLRATFYRWLAQRLVHRSICAGHYLMKWFCLRPQAVTYGAVAIPQNVSEPSEEPRAVFVGRLAPDTGLDIYLRGLGLLKRKYNMPLTLTVCGDGPMRGILEQLATDEDVEAEFVGFVSDPFQYVSQAKIVFASGYLAMLEAMACRRPLFCVYHSPVKEDYLRMVPNSDQMFVIADGPDQLAVQLAAFLTGQLDLSHHLERAYQFGAGQSWAKLADLYVRLWGEA